MSLWAYATLKIYKSKIQKLNNNIHDFTSVDEFYCRHELPWQKYKLLTVSKLSQNRGLVFIVLLCIL